MRVAKQIKKILAEEEISLTELANRLDISVNNLSNKLRRDNFKTEELEFIADKLGYTVDINFIKKSLSFSNVSSSVEFTDEEIKELPEEMVNFMVSEDFSENYKLVLKDEIELHLHKVGKELIEKAILKTAVGNPLNKED